MKRETGLLVAIGFFAGCVTTGVVAPRVASAEKTAGAIEYVSVRTDSATTQDADIERLNELGERGFRLAGTITYNGTTTGYVLMR